MTIRSKTPNDAFKSNFDKIFGTEEDRKAKLAKEREEHEANVRAFKQANKNVGLSASVQVGFQEFRSPIDGTMITCPAKLREHNKRHQVTDIRDYGDEWFDKKREEHRRTALGQTKEAEQERRALIEKNLYKYGILR